VPARAKARKRALDILYAADLRGEDAVAALDRAIAEGEGPTNPYTEELVRGVVAHLPRIDELISTYSQNWALNRMPAVDRTALRIGTFELLWSDEVPDIVAIDQAVSLVQQLSTDESPAFVNGILDAMMRGKDQIAV